MSEYVGNDPGNAGSISVDRDFIVVPLVSAGIETRVLPVPVRPGLNCLIAMYTDGGDTVLTVTSGYDQGGNTTITFNTAGDWVLLHSIPTASGNRWRVAAGEGTNVAGVSATSYSATELTGTTVNAGADATAGTVQVFPTTTASGKLVLSCTDQTGNTAVTVNADAMGQATAVHLADPGIAASYLLQSTAAISVAEANVLDAAIIGTVVASKAVVASAGKDVSNFRNVGYEGALTAIAGAATPAVVARFGKTATEGLEVKVYDEIVELTNAVTTNTTLAVPAGAVVLSAQANLQATITGDASGDDLLAKIGLGITGSVVKYGVTSALTKNAKIDTVPDWAVNAGETLALYAVKADGSTAATEKFTGGATQLVRVRVVYLAANSLDDAA
jgi:hypothetical protein